MSLIAEFNKIYIDRFAIIKRVYDVFTYIGIDPFMPIMQFFLESRFTFHAYNTDSGAMGLGQQMPTNIIGFGFPYQCKKCFENQKVDQHNRLYGFDEHGANIDLNIQMYLNLLHTFSFNLDADIKRTNGQLHPVFGFLRAYAGGPGTYPDPCIRYHVRLFFRNFYFPHLMQLYLHVRKSVTETLNRSDMVQLFHSSLEKIMQDFKNKCPVQYAAGYKPFVLEYINDPSTKVPSNLIDPTKINYFKNGIKGTGAMVNLGKMQIKVVGISSFETYVNGIKSRLNSSPTLQALRDIVKAHQEKPISTYDPEVTDFNAAYQYAETHNCYGEGTPYEQFFKTKQSYYGTDKVNEYMFYVYTIKPDFSGLIYNGKEYLFGTKPPVIESTSYKPSGGGGIGYSSGFSNCGCSGVGQAGCTPKEDDRAYSQGTNKEGCADCAKMLDSDPFNSTQFGTNCIGSSPDPTKACSIESVNMQEYLKIFVGAENINENGDLNGELKMNEIKPYY
ncbi:MAG: hypothetical protein QW255_05330, partial [Candidatus Bilamarchaeaceae archaeon]